MKNSRYPERAEKGKCRGCGEPVPKGRQTWCSAHCFEIHDPRTARMLVKQRDKEVCSFCGVDTKKLKRRFPPHFQGPYVNKFHPRFRPQGIHGPFDSARYERAVLIRQKHSKRWFQAAEKRRSKMREDGWPRCNSRHWWEADHIIPHSEGGTHELSNMRTLCIPCHKARTKAWHKSRKAIKKADQIDLILA